MLLHHYLFIFLVCTQHKSKIYNHVWDSASRKFGYLQLLFEGGQDLVDKATRLVIRCAADYTRRILDRLEALPARCLMQAGSRDSAVL